MLPRPAWGAFPTELVHWKDDLVACAPKGHLEQPNTTTSTTTHTTTHSGADTTRHPPATTPSHGGGPTPPPPARQSTTPHAPTGGPKPAGEGSLVPLVLGLTCGGVGLVAVVSAVFVCYRRRAGTSYVSRKER